MCRLASLMLLLLLSSGCGSDTPPATPVAPATPPTNVADPVPADHVLQPQLQTLDKARGVQDLADEAKERIDAAADEQRP